MSSPAHKLRDGCLQVVIWRNTSEKGTYYTANPTRSYRQGDETWKETDSLNTDDLLAMTELLREPDRFARECVGQVVLLFNLLVGFVRCAADQLARRGTDRAFQNETAPEPG